MSIQSGAAFQFLSDQCIDGNHSVRNDTLFFAMYSTLADIDPVTVDDQASNSDEVVDVGYTAGGEQLTQTIIYTTGQPDRPVSEFEDLEVVTGSTWGIRNDAAQGADIYTRTAGPLTNRVQWAHYFGHTIAVNNGTFTVRWPDPTDPTLAIIRTSG